MTRRHEIQIIPFSLSFLPPVERKGKKLLYFLIRTTKLKSIELNWKNEFSKARLSSFARISSASSSFPPISIPEKDADLKSNEIYILNLKIEKFDWIIGKVFCSIFRFRVSLFPSSSLALHFNCYIHMCIRYMKNILIHSIQTFHKHFQHTSMNMNRRRWDVMIWNWCWIFISLSCLYVPDDDVPTTFFVASVADEAECLKFGLWFWFWALLFKSKLFPMLVFGLICWFDDDEFCCGFADTIRFLLFGRSMILELREESFFFKFICQVKTWEKFKVLIIWKLRWGPLFPVSSLPRY